MSNNGLISIDHLDELIEQHPNFKNGCLLDTNILVSASLTIDPKNEEAESLIRKLTALKIPVYSNVNIRSEFLEVQRRILIPECLIELYETNEDFEDIVNQKLKSVQTSYRKALEDKKVYKFTDARVKEFRDLLSMKPIKNKNGWSYFCETLLAPQMATVWEAVVDSCRLNFIKIRENETHPLLTTKVSWDGVTDIMGKTGVSSSDAMILNLLLSSKIELVATADSDIQYLVDSLKSQGKSVLVFAN